jgi:hypothetical protein
MSCISEVTEKTRRKGTRMPLRALFLLLVAAMVMPQFAAAHRKTDVITLYNGDRESPANCRSC